MARSTTKQKQPLAALTLGAGYGQQFRENQRLAWRYVWCAGYDEIDSKRVFHHFANKKCDCPPGPQVQGLLSDAFETALCGGRGGLKTETGLGFTIKGNPDKTERPCDITYLNHSRYRFLVLRKNSVDLDDWVRRAKTFYGLFGGVVTENPMKVRFPSGTEGIFSHMQDEDAYEKYQGQEFHRIVLEELTQIPSEDLYMKIIMSCRSSFSELIPQVLVTANPGGPGSTWFRKRFLDLKHEDGRPLKSGEMYTDPRTGMTRMFIHSTVYDNPYFMRDNAMYVKQLEMLPENQRRRWLYGDFNAVEGQYFTDFRPEGPFPDEEEKYPWARHVIPAVKLMPWWTRWIGMDWGFAHDGAAIWNCQHPNGQIHVYDELVQKGVGAEEWGVQIAERSIRDLEGLESHHMDLFLSPDAFSKRNDEKTIAEQIAWGIQRVLGEDSCRVLSPSETAKGGDFFDAADLQGKASITIRPAPNQRVAGWQYMHSLLRFRPIAQGIEKPDMEYARSLIEDGNNFDKYLQYLKAFERQEKPEVLPRLVIHDCCPRIAQGIASAIQDERNPDDVLKCETDNEIDAQRYALMGYKQTIAKEPYQSYRQRHLDRTAALHPEGMDANMLVWANRKAEQVYAQQGSNEPVFIARASSRRAHSRVN